MFISGVIVALLARLREGLSIWIIREILVEIKLLTAISICPEAGCGSDFWLKGEVASKCGFPWKEAILQRWLLKP